MQGDCDRYYLEPSYMLLLIFLFFYAVGYHSRLVEVTSRLDFLWKQQATKELNDISEMRQHNTQLLKNILPDHVANYFLSANETGERKIDVRTSSDIYIFLDYLYFVSYSKYLLFEITVIIPILN